MGFFIRVLSRIANGLTANDGTGDPLRTGGDKINANYDVIVDTINALASSQNVNMLAFATKALMDADTSRADGTVARVLFDTTPANNKTYAWVSATPAWVETLDALSYDLASTAAGKGGALVAFLQAGSGASARTIQDKARDILSFKDFGAVADYSGTPQYDGVDGSRITATDNHDAWIAFVQEMATSGRAGFIPAGHYGVKTPHATPIATTKDIRIIAEKGAIIDFIFEDQTGTDYILDADANMLLRMTASGGAEFYCENLRIKATTYLGPIGTTGQIQYKGKVFGIRLDGFASVEHHNCVADHFAFKGWTAVNSDSWLIQDCGGFYNISSGWWAAANKKVTVKGGEFAYNGMDGYPLTGYGVTAQQSIEDYVVDGGYFHHNHRKGVDSHGSKNTTVRNCRFESNIVADIGLPLGTGIAYTGGVVSVTDNIFHRGTNATEKAWMQARYSNAKDNGYVDYAGAVLNLIESGVHLGTVGKCVFARNEVHGGYRGGDYQSTADCALIRVSSTTADVVIRDNEIDAPEMATVASTVTNGYMRALIAFPNTVGLKATLSGNTINMDWASAYVKGGTTYYGQVIGLSAGALVSVDSNDITIQDQWMFNYNPTNTVFTWLSGHQVKMRKNTIAADRLDLSNFNSKWFGRLDPLDPNVDVFIDNTFIVDGVRHVLTGMPNTRHQQRDARATTTLSWAAAAAVLRIVIDPKANTTLTIQAFKWGLEGVITVVIDASGASASVSGTNSLMTFAVDNSYVDTDGNTKIAVTGTAVAAIPAGVLAVHTELYCRSGSLGVEKIEFLS